MRRAYSLIDWLIVIAVALGVAAMMRSGIKREVDAKARGMSDYMLWTGWHQNVPRDTDAFRPDQNFQAKTGGKQGQTQIVREDTDGSVSTDFTISRSSRTASLGVGKDQEYLLTNRSLHDFDFNIDTSND